MLNALLNRLKKHLSDQDDATLHITGKAVQEMLAQAEIMRQKMFVNFTQDEHPRSFVGFCMHLDSQHILIDIGDIGEFGEVALLGESAGGEALVHFAAHGGGTAFFKFTTRIRGVRNRRGKTELLLDLPKELTCAQRRGFFRLVPPVQSIRILCVLKADDISFLPDNVGKESFICDDAMAASWSLVNISASGMRIARRLQKKNPFAIIETDDRLICYLELIPPDNENLLRLWKICTVAYSLAEEDRVTLGLSYKAWTEPVPDTQPNTWHKLDKIDYIDSLHRWVLKQQFKINAQASLKTKGIFYPP